MVKNSLKGDPKLAEGLVLTTMGRIILNDILPERMPSTTTP